MNYINPDFEKLAPGWLDSPLNIEVGKAKVPFAPESEGYPASWVLPGGIRTQDRADAIRAAQWMATRIR